MLADQNLRCDCSNLLLNILTMKTYFEILAHLRKFPISVDIAHSGSLGKLDLEANP